MKRNIISLILLCAAPFSIRAQHKNNTNPPSPIHPIPTQAQIEWHKLETYAFIHFGLNTYNDLEWGFGNTPAHTFSPNTLDCEQWVSTLKSAGMKGIILTAKHHDGFCLWPTKTTDYSVQSSPWKDGQGDLVRDLSDACRRHGLRFGLYLSPWDRHNAEYGREGYQKVFHEQIQELTTNYGELFEYWFDGANGGTGWYGGANEARSIDPNTYYKYHEACEILRRNNPDIMIFGGTEPTIRWIGNEAGWAGETNWASYDYNKERGHKQAQWGMRDAQYWIPGEVDVSIRPGWFYHQREDHQVRSVANLINLYYSSVGRGANLLLNFPINLDGKIPQQDSTNIIQWRKVLDESFRHNLLIGSKITAHNTRKGKTFRPKHLTDGTFDSYWATTDEQNTADLTFHFKQPKRFNNVLLQEYIALGQRVESFSLSYLNTDDQWHPLPTTDSLTTIGYKRLIRSTEVEAKALRIQITQSKGVVCLSEIGAYLTPPLFDEPKVYRDDQDRLHITNNVPDAQMSYRVRKSEAIGEWLPYQGATLLSGDDLQIEVRVDNIAPSDHPPLQPIYLGISATRLSTPELDHQQRKALLDGQGNTALHLDKNSPQHILVTLTEPMLIDHLVYTPDQRRDASGHIQHYALYIDGQMILEGEFANIKNNPIPTQIKLPKAMLAKEIRLVNLKSVDGVPYTSIGGIELFGK